jgi:uncharacterized protein (UPF0332 family)
VPDPADLLAVARLLLGAGTTPAPSEAQLRRAVSSAYYALFHKVLHAATDRFVGTGKTNSAAYAIIYRSFDHQNMKNGCESLQASTLSQKTQSLLRRAKVSQATHDFASNFPSLQQSRHLADYDPASHFGPSDAVSLVDSAEAAMEAFDRIPADEKLDVLAFLMVRARS